MITNACNELYAALAYSFRGDLLRPDHAGFSEAASIWNAAAQRRPGLIARCGDVADIQLAVKTASSLGVATAVRCGGHSLAGYSSCDDGMVIDLSRMREVRVDEGARRATLAGGCLLGSVDRATQSVGLAFPAGVVSHTGASGLILGGGTGWLTRAFGLSCDNVGGFQVVLADGSLVRADRSDNPDLYWALRGGGGNFGIVTEFAVRLHPMRSVFLAEALWGEQDLLPLMAEWQSFMAAAPERLKWNLSLMVAPDAERIPESLRGKPVASGAMIFVNDMAAGESSARKMFSIRNPLATSSREISFLQLQTIADDVFPHGRRYYTKSGYFDRLGAEEVATMLRMLPQVPSARTQIELAYLGGAAARVEAGETAFGDRSAPIIINILTDWDHEQDDEKNKGWVREMFDSLRPGMKPGVYINFMSGDEDDRTTEAYQERWNRLVAVKSQYDPNNFFRLNQNIRPKAGLGGNGESA